MREEAGAVEAVVNGVRHLKVWVSDLEESRQWYERVFALEHVLDFEDLDGVVRGMAFRVPHASFEFALRENPRLAGALYDADPFALATTREALDAWCSDWTTSASRTARSCRRHAASPWASTTPTGCRCACTPTTPRSPQRAG